jgi:hypothetical protein
MKQSRLMSLIEAITNVIVGYGVAVVTQVLIFPLFGLHTTLAQNLKMAAPMTTALMMAARKEAQGLIPDPAGANPSDAAPDTDGIALALAKAVARVSIRDWKGVGDANGFPVPVSAEGVDALLDIWPIFEAFQTRYVARAMILEAEKNASPPLPSGNSAGAATTAKPARKTARTARRG